MLFTAAPQNKTNITAVWINFPDKPADQYTDPAVIWSLHASTPPIWAFRTPRNINIYMYCLQEQLKSSVSTEIIFRNAKELKMQNVMPYFSHLFSERYRRNSRSARNTICHRNAELKLVRAVPHRALPAFWCSSKLFPGVLVRSITSATRIQFSHASLCFLFAEAR